MKSVLYSRFFLFFTACVCLFLGLSACTNRGEPVIPKPRGFHRITFPDKHYSVFSTTCPMKLEIPDYAFMEANQHDQAQACWMDLVFPTFNARLHLSYFPVGDQATLRELLEDSHQFAFSHSSQASAIRRIPIERSESAVYGLWYHLEGPVASSLQFYVTDSVTHYLRGALYFNEAPKVDSLQPVLEFIRADIQHMVETLEWK